MLYIYIDMSNNNNITPPDGPGSAPALPKQNINPFDITGMVNYESTLNAYNEWTNEDKEYKEKLLIDINNANTKITNLNSENDKLKSNLSNIDDKYKNQFNNLQSQIGNINQDKINLSSKNQKLESQLNVSNTTVESLREQLKKKELLYNQTSNQLSQVNTKLGNAKLNFNKALYNVSNVKLNKDEQINFAQGAAKIFSKRILSDATDKDALYKLTLDTSNKLNNEKQIEIQEEKLNIINNTKNLLKSNNKLLNISREIDINDQEYNFRNKIANILGVTIIIGIIVTLIIVSTYLISNINQTIQKMRTIFG